MPIAAGSEAFAGPLGYAETVTNHLLGGVVPMTLVAARSRGVWVHRITRGGDTELVRAAVTRDGSTIGISPTHA